MLRDIKEYHLVAKMALQTTQQTQHHSRICGHHGDNVESVMAQGSGVLRKVQVMIEDLPFEGMEHFSEWTDRALLSLIDSKVTLHSLGIYLPDLYCINVISQNPGQFLNPDLPSLYLTAWMLAGWDVLKETAPFRFKILSYKGRLIPQHGEDFLDGHPKSI